MITFNDFVKKQNLRNKATSSIKIYEVLKKTGLDSEVRTYWRDGPFPSDIGLVNLHPSKGTHRVCYIKENYFDSYGCVPPRKLSRFIIKRNSHCFLFRIQDTRSDK